MRTKRPASGPARSVASEPIPDEAAVFIGLARDLRPVIALAATWAAGFFDALHHARDAWAIMPTAMVLSVIVAVLAFAATWIGFSGLRAGGAK